MCLWSFIFYVLTYSQWELSMFLCIFYLFVHTQCFLSNKWMCQTRKGAHSTNVLVYVLQTLIFPLLQLQRHICAELFVMKHMGTTMRCSWVGGVAHQNNSLSWYIFLSPLQLLSKAAVSCITQGQFSFMSQQLLPHS